jgi:hypothetical protein
VEQNAAMSADQEKVSWSVVHRPSDMGIDLPPGASATSLKPADYHVIDMEEGIEDRPRWLKHRDQISHPS